MTPAPVTHERFFLPPPTSTGQDVSIPADHGPAAFGIYLDADGREMRWSAPFPLPAVHSRVWVNMNSIGWSRVKGYFCSPGDKEGKTQYVGLMVKPTNPPAYYRRQTREDAKRPDAPQWMRDGIGCVFGTEIRLKRPAPLEPRP